MEQGGNVIVVTVTYGNRINLLDEVISVLRSDNYINEIIVINNGSSTDLKKYFETNSKVRVVDLLNNTGSANGFNVGIEMARANSNCEYIWLLDDDNKPENNALELLISYYNDFKEKYKKMNFRYFL
ncbi:glycosyltransferase [Niallia sp. Marseille-Q9988]